MGIFMSEMPSRRRFILFFAFLSPGCGQVQITESGSIVWGFARSLRKTRLQRFHGIILISRNRHSLPRLRGG
jgi:hypothetical protein